MKTTLKRALSYFLTLTMLLSLMVFPASAASSVTLGFEDQGYYDESGLYVVGVTLTSDDGEPFDMYSGEIYVSFDKSQLELVDADAEGMIADAEETNPRTGKVTKYAIGFTAPDLGAANEDGAFALTFSDGNSKNHSITSGQAIVSLYFGLANDEVENGTSTLSFATPSGKTNIVGYWDDANKNYTLVESETYDIEIANGVQATLDSVSLSPSSSVEVDGATTVPAITATALSTKGTAMSGMTWSVEPVDQGVSIDETGAITVDSKATDGSYTVTATQAVEEGDPITKTATLTVTRAESALDADSSSISGEAASLTIPYGNAPAASSGDFTLTAKDQFGGAFTPTAVTWSVVDANGDAVTGVTAVSDAENVTKAHVEVDATAKTDIEESAELTVKATVGNVTLAAENKVTVSRETSVLTSVTVSGGVETIYVPADNAEANTSKFTAELKDQYGATVTDGDVTWTIAPETTGVSIDGGVVTVTNEAKSAISENGTMFTVTATSGGKSGTKTVEVKRAASAPATITVTGDSSIGVPYDGEDAETRKFAAGLKDQYGAPVTGSVTWSIAPETAGVRIDAEGTLTVTNDAKAAIADTVGTQITVTATSGEITGEKAITVARQQSSAATVNIMKGEAVVTTDTLSIPASDSKSETYTAKVFGQYGEELADASVEWTLTNANDYVTNEGGVVTVAAGATANSEYKLTATSGTASGSVDIKVVDIAIIWPGTNEKTTPVYGDKWSDIVVLSDGGSASIEGTDVPGTFSIVYGVSGTETDAKTADDVPASGVQVYDIVFKSTDGAYTVYQKSESAKVNVTKAPLTVSANNATITYGAEPANSGVTYAGFVNGDDENVLTGELAYEFTYQQYGDIGNHYTITPSGLTADNYDITYAAGTLTVEPAEITVSGITADGKTYDGTTDATLVCDNAVLNGVVNNDDVSVTATGTFADANAGEGKSVTISDLELTGDKAGNYVLAEEGQQSEATASISKLTAQLVWSGCEARDYNGAASNVTATVGNAVEGETVTVTVVDGDKTDAGEYTAKADTLSSDNYELPQSAEQSYKINKISSGTEPISEFTLKSIEATNEAQEIVIDLNDCVKFTAAVQNNLMNSGEVLYGELAFNDGGFLNSSNTAYDPNDSTKLVITIPAGGAKLDGTSDTVKVAVETKNFDVEPVELKVVFKNKMDVSSDIAFGADQYEVTYGETYSVTATYSHGETVETIDPATFVYTDSTGAELESAPTDAGTYTVTAKWDDDTPEGGLYGHAGEASTTLTIKKLVAELEWNNDLTYTYSGEPVVIFATVKNALDGDDVKALVKEQSGVAAESVSRKDATSSNVTVVFDSLAGDSAKNYDAPTAALTTVFKIEKKDISVDYVDVADETRPYTGDTTVGKYTIRLKDVLAADEELICATAATAEWVSADVGTKQIKLTGVELASVESAPDAYKNYNLASEATVDADIAITKADNSWKYDDEQNQLLPSIEGWTYGETASEEFAGKPTFDEAPVITWATKDGTALDAKPTAAGDYTMTATVAGTDNYNELTATVEFSIAKAERDIKVDPEALTVYANGGTITVTFADDDNTGTLKATQSVVSALSLSNEKKDGSVVYTITPLADSDGVVLTFKLDESANYKAASATATVKTVLNPLQSVTASATGDDKAHLTATVDGDKIVVTGYKSVADAEIVVDPVAVEGLEAAVENGKVVVKDGDTVLKSYEIDATGVSVLETETTGALELNDQPTETNATGSAEGTDVTVENVADAAASALADDAAKLETEKQEDINNAGFENGYTLDVETKVSVEAKDGDKANEMKLAFNATYTVTAVENDENGNKSTDENAKRVVLTPTPVALTKLANKVKVEVKLPVGFVPTVVKHILNGLTLTYALTLSTAGAEGTIASWEQDDFEGEVLLVADNRYGTITFTDADGAVLSTADYTINNLNEAFPAQPVLTNKTATGWTLDGKNVGDSLTDELLTQLDENNHALTLVASYKDKNTGGSDGGGSSSGGGSSETVKVDKASNGSMDVSNPKAKAGETVTLTPKPDKGYKFENVTVKDSNGNVVPVSKNSDGSYSFTMPEKGGVTITPKFAEKTTPSFVDVPAGSFYADAVDWAVNNDITNGTSETTFSPDNACTRAEAITLLYRAAGSPDVEITKDFSDVSANAYYAKAVSWAVANGITNGTGEGKFSPNLICTRAQIVTFLYRCANGMPGMNTFTDVPTDAYYASAVGWAVANGITKGTGNGTTFSPNATCTRSQIVTFLYRAFNK